MMSHEEVLTRSLSGGPMPLEAADHLAACLACRAELEALRAVETALRRARPALAPQAGIPLVTPVREHRTAFWSQAAAAVLLLGLLGGFWAGRAVPKPDTATEGDPASVRITYTAADDSTFALLSASDTLAAQEPSAEELADYVETHWGG